MTHTPRRGRFLLACGFVALVCVGGVAMVFNGSTVDSEGLLPPRAEKDSQGPVPIASPPSGQMDQAPGVDAHGDNEEDGTPLPPGAATLAGPPAEVVRQFAYGWANRNTVLTPAMKQEMVGLSAGGWATAVARKADLSLPAIEGIQAEGGLVMMRLSKMGPGSKTALVVTKEALLGPEGAVAPPRYEIYLARLDRVGPRGYAVTAWEPQR